VIYSTLLCAAVGAYKNAHRGSKHAVDAR